MLGPAHWLYGQPESLCQLRRTVLFPRRTFLSSIENSLATAAAFFCSGLQDCMVWPMGIRTKSSRSCGAICQSNLGAKKKCHVRTGLSYFWNFPVVRYEIAFQETDAPPLWQNKYNLTFIVWFAKCSQLRTEFGSPISRRRIFIFLVRRDLMAPGIDHDLRSLVLHMTQRFRRHVGRRTFNWHLGFYVKTSSHCKLMPTLGINP